MKVYRNENGIATLVPQTAQELGWLDSLEKSALDRSMIEFSEWSETVLLPAYNKVAHANLSTRWHCWCTTTYRKIMLRGCRQVGLSTMLAAFITYRLVVFGEQKITIVTSNAKQYAALVDKVIDFYQAVQSQRDRRLDKLPSFDRTLSDYASATFSDGSCICSWQPGKDSEVIDADCFIVDNFVHFGKKVANSLIQIADRLTEDKKSAVAVFASDMGSDDKECEWFDKMFADKESDRAWSCRSYAYYTDDALITRVNEMLEEAYPGFTRQWKCVTKYDIAQDSKDDDNTEAMACVSAN